MNKGLFEASEEGTPQGGPLSPLLSNIMLNELDKELKRRGLPFVRYADDSMIYHLANMKRLLLVTDEWLRRRIRMCIWKAWKKAKTKVANLIKCGINKYQAYEWGNFCDAMTKSGKSHVCVNNFSGKSDFLRFYVYLCRMSNFPYLRTINFNKKQ